MKHVLKRRKHGISEDEWRFALKNIKSLISFEEVEELAIHAIKNIEVYSEGRKAGYGWSGGKDSIVLSHLCERAGIRKGVFGRCDLEYPSFMEWVSYNIPPGIATFNSGQDIAWLAEKVKTKPEILFPLKPSVTGWWATIIQHKAQEWFLKHNDMIILGRRQADGNFTGGGLYKKKNGKYVFNPLVLWSHEAVLGYIVYHDLKLPPIYEWKNGFSNGTLPWASRIHTPRVQNPDNWMGAWEEIYEIDPTILYEAAAYFKTAEDFLKLKGDK